MEPLRYVGTRVPKVDAESKVTGQAAYIHDLSRPKMLWGKIVRSPLSHAHIRHIDVSRARALPGVRAVLTAADVPPTRFGFARDNVLLKGDRVRSLHDEVAAIAAVDWETAEEAADLVHVEYEELPAVFTPEEAMAPGAPALHDEAPGNIITRIPYAYTYRHGDVEAALGRADVVLTTAFDLPPVAYASLGTLACIAEWDVAGRLTLWSTTQVPFLLIREIADVLGIEGERVRIHQPPIGGAFGRGLDMYPTEPICALLARATGCPVKIVHTRHEEFASMPTRQPARITLTTAAAGDGHLMARDARFLLDCGAYVSWGATTPLVMLTTIVSHSVVPHARFEGTLVYTNNPSTGAMRGYGNLQATFAVESHMDMLAERLGIDPVEIRLRNANYAGQVTPQGLRISTCGFADCLQEVATAIEWKEKRGQGRAADRPRGVGLATMFHVAGGARVYRSDGCGTTVKFNPFGGATVITGATEIGQGADTGIALIVAETLGIPVENVTVIASDTDVKPWDVGTHASRTLFVAGNSARLAALDARAQLLAAAEELLEARAGDLEIRDGRICVRGSPDRFVMYDKVLRALHFREKGRTISAYAFYDPPNEMLDKRFCGNISVTYGFAAQAAEVEVDPETGVITVLRVVAAHDSGRTINPLGAEGSVEGGVHMGLGYALSEEVVLSQGRMLNANFEDYIMLTAQDMPPVDVRWIETDDPAGPFGAKGIGESGCIPTAAAVANAVADAIGVHITALPLTPQRVLAALTGKASG